jgi:hypothetical protein
MCERRYINIFVYGHITQKAFNLDKEVMVFSFF